MTRSTRKPSLRLTVTLLTIIVLAVVSMALAPSARCCQVFWEQTYFYYDAEHTQYAGMCEINCLGQFSCYGDRTDYYEYSLLYPCGPCGS